MNPVEIPQMEIRPHTNWQEIKNIVEIPQKLDYISVDNNHVETDWTALQMTPIQ